MSGRQSHRQGSESETGTGTRSTFNAYYKQSKSSCSIPPLGWLSLSLSLSSSLLMSLELTGLGRYGLVLQSHFTGTDRATAHTSARKPLNNFLLIYCALTYSNWEVVNNTNQTYSTVFLLHARFSNKKKHLIHCVFRLKMALCVTQYSSMFRRLISLFRETPSARCTYRSLIHMFVAFVGKNPKKIRLFFSSYKEYRLLFLGICFTVYPSAFQLCKIKMKNKWTIASCSHWDLNSVNDLYIHDVSILISIYYRRIHREPVTELKY